MKVKEESEKVGLKLNILKTKIMAPNPITSWQIDWETVAAVTDFILGGLQNHCSWWLQPWKLKYTCCLEENYDQPRQHIKKQRHYFVNKHPSSQSYGFPVVMYQFERWTIKKAEHRKIDAFELWCWRRLLRVPWTARTSNQFILKKSVVNIHWTDWCWSWSSNTLATWCEELTHLNRLWCWERLKAGGEGDHRGWDGWLSPPNQWAWV